MSPLSPKGFAPSMPSTEPVGRIPPVSGEGEAASDSANGGVSDAEAASYAPPSEAGTNEPAIAAQPGVGDRFGDIDSAAGRLSQLAESVFECIEELREADPTEDPERTGDDEEVLECDAAPEAEGEAPGEVDDKDASGGGADDGEEGNEGDDGDQADKQDSESDGDGKGDKSNGKGSQNTSWFDALPPPGFLIAPPPGVQLRRTYVAAMDSTRKQGKRHHRERRKLLLAARKNHPKRQALLRKLFVIRLLLLCLEALLIRMRMELQQEAAQAQFELVRV